jgi:hypothetical protein
MSQRFYFRFAAAAGVLVAGMLGGAAVRAQDDMLHPPKVLVIVREDTKPGKGGLVHERSEQLFIRAFKKGKGANYIAATTTTYSNSAYFFSAYDSFADWEKDNQTVAKNAGADIDLALQHDGELLTSSRTMTAVLRADLSYHANFRPIKGLRYFVMYTVRVRPGHEDEFVEARKHALAAHEKANLPDSYSIYQVNSGAPTGTFIFFVPMNSLAEMDEFPVVHGKAYQDALGEEGQKALREFDRNGLIGAESILVELSPKMSYPPKAFVDADPDFWAPKPAAAAKAAATKREGKKE